MNEERQQAIIDLAEICTQDKIKIATAESCTGGGLAYWLTSVAGSSNWFERGFVTYSNDAKHELLGVSNNTLETYGAVSEETAREMAEGTLAHSRANIAVSITGIAGPDGGSGKKPVGTVWFGVADRTGYARALMHAFTGDRIAIRLGAIDKAIELLLEALR